MQVKFAAAAAKSLEKLSEKSDAIMCAMRTAYYTAYYNIPVSEYPSLL